MTIYLDSDFRCHLVDDGTRSPIETDAFDGKCASYIEGYRYVLAARRGLGLTECSSMA